MLKNSVRIFGKNCTNRLSLACLWRLGAPAPDPRVVTSAYYYSFVEFISSTKCVLLPSKENKITTVNDLFLLLPHFFI